MNLQHIKSFEGSPKPADLFQPHMPGVELLSDMDALFTKARDDLRYMGVPTENKVEGQRYIAIITPGRLIMYRDCPPPGSLPPEVVESVTKLLPPNTPLNISVVTYTLLEALMEDATKCIPFLGYLFAFGYIGHHVVAFEGHPSTFRSAVRGSDVLMIDSGMLPFIQENWLDVAYEVMRPNPKIWQ